MPAAHLVARQNLHTADGCNAAQFDPSQACDGVSLNIARLFSDAWRRMSWIRLSEESRRPSSPLAKLIVVFSPPPRKNCPAKGRWWARPSGDVNDDFFDGPVFYCRNKFIDRRYHFFELPMRRPHHFRQNNHSIASCGYRKAYRRGTPCFYRNRSRLSAARCRPVRDGCARSGLTVIQKIQVCVPNEFDVR